MTKIITDFSNYTITPEGVITNTVTNHTKSQWLGANGYYHVDLQQNGVKKKVAVHRLLALHYLPNPHNKRTVNHIDGNKLNNSLDNLEWATDSENCQHAYDTGLQPYRKKYTEQEYENILTNQFLKGESITSIAHSGDNCLTQFSIHLKSAAIRLNKLPEYKKELTRQKAIRAKQAGINNRNLITIHMLDKDTNNIVKVFTSVTEAQQHLKAKSSGPISNALSGRQKTAYGYKWKKL